MICKKLGERGLIQQTGIAADANMAHAWTIWEALVELGEDGYRRPGGTAIWPDDTPDNQRFVVLPWTRS